MHTADDEIIKRRDRVGLGPQAHLARAIASIAMLQEQHAIQIRLDVLADGDDPNRMPLPECGWLYTRARQLVSSTVIVIEPKVVLQGVGPHDIIMPLGEAKDDATRGIFPALYRLEPDRDVDIGVRTRGRHNHVKGVLRSPLDQHPLATGRAWHRFHSPPARHGVPALDALLLKVEALYGCLRRHRELGSVD